RPDFAPALQRVEIVLDFGAQRPGVLVGQLRLEAPVAALNVERGPHVQTQKSERCDVACTEQAEKVGFFGTGSAGDGNGEGEQGNPAAANGSSHHFLLATIASSTSRNRSLPK